MKPGSDRLVASEGRHRLPIRHQYVLTDAVKSHCKSNVNCLLVSLRKSFDAFLHMLSTTSSSPPPTDLSSCPAHTALPSAAAAVAMAAAAAAAVVVAAGAAAAAVVVAAGAAAAALGVYCITPVCSRGGRPASGTFEPAFRAAISE